MIVSAHATFFKRGLYRIFVELDSIQNLPKNLRSPLMLLVYVPLGEYLRNITKDE